MLMGACRNGIGGVYAEYMGFGNAGVGSEVDWIENGVEMRMQVRDIEIVRWEGNNRAIRKN